MRIGNALQKLASSLTSASSASRSSASDPLSQNQAHLLQLLNSHHSSRLRQYQTVFAGDDGASGSVPGSGAAAGAERAPFAIVHVSGYIRQWPLLPGARAPGQAVPAAAAGGTTSALVALGRLQVTSLPPPPSSAPSSEVTLRLTPEGRVTYCDPSVNTLLGHQSSEILGADRSPHLSQIQPTCLT